MVGKNTVVKISEKFPVYKAKIHLKILFRYREKKRNENTKILHSVMKSITMFTPN